MYKDGGILMLGGVLLSLGFIILLGWYVNTKISSALNSQGWLTRFVALLLTCLLGLFIVDKLVSWEIKLLSDEMSNGLFELINNAYNYANIIIENCKELIYETSEILKKDKLLKAEKIEELINEKYK